MRNNPLALEFLLMVFIAAVLLSACDMGSYNPIARSLDPYNPLGPGTMAWIRGSGDSSTDGEAVAKVFLLEMGAPVRGDTGGFVYIEIHDKAGALMQTQVSLYRGNYEVVSSSNLTLYPVVEFTGSYQQTSSPTNFPAPIDWTGRVVTTSYGSDSFGGESYYELSLILSDASDASDATRLLTIYHAGIIASQVVVPGFGGIGMTTYTTPSTFRGLVTGETLVGMPVLLPLAKVDFTYDVMESFPGMPMSNLLRTSSNARGDGSMSGIISIELEGGPYMTVSYDDIKLLGTVPSEGDYHVTVGEHLANVAYDTLIPGHINYDLIGAP